MGLVTLQDISLHDYTLESLPLVRELRGKNLDTAPEICVERARKVTRYLKKLSSADEPMETRYAGAVSYFLSSKEPFFFDGNLLAGTTTSKCFGAPVYPELTGLTIWPELDTVSTRDKNPLILSNEDA